MKTFPKTKICGITRVRDANLAARLGAEFLGLIMYKSSPRVITLRLAKTIIESTPPTVQFVLVFVNEAVEVVIARARRLRCSIVQLHGKYSAADVSRIQKAGLRVIRAFQICDVIDLEKASGSCADFVLLDTKDTSDDKVHGGTGKSFNWELLKRRSKRPRNMILAGGLSVANFKKAVQVAEPLVLDFNSGVESSPGIKSALKLKRLFAAQEKWMREND